MEWKLSEQDAEPAITIVANSDRVVDVKWYIKTFQIMIITTTAFT